MRGILRGLGPNVFALGMASFFTDVASEMIFPLMPFFIVGTLKAGPAALGLIEGLANSLSSLLRIVSGWLSDRFRRRKPFIVWGYGIAAACRPCFAIATAAWHVLVIRLVDRFGKGLRLAARDALLADSCDPDVRGKAFGFQHAMDNLGAALGPVIAFALMRWAGMPLRTVFLVTAIPAACVLLVVGGFVKEVPPKAAAPKPPRLSLKPFDGRFRFFLVIVAVFTLGNSSDSFLILRVSELMQSRYAWTPEQTAMHVPLVWTGVCLVRALAGIPGGMLADRLGRKGAVLLGWAIYGAVYAGIAFAGGLTGLLILLGLYGLWSALGDSVARAVVADLVPEELKGTAYGLYHFCVGLAALPASLGFGWIYQRWSPQAAFTIGACCAAAAWILLVFLPVRQRPMIASSAA